MRSALVIEGQACCTAKDLTHQKQSKPCSHCCTPKLMTQRMLTKCDWDDGSMPHKICGLPPCRADADPASSFSRMQTWQTTPCQEPQILKCINRSPAAITVGGSTTTSSHRADPGRTGKLTPESWSKLEGAASACHETLKTQHCPTHVLMHQPHAGTLPMVHKSGNENPV